MLQNKAEKLIDPDLRRKYNLDLETKGDAVYEVLERDEKGKIVRKALMARVLALSTFYNDKGSGLFDADFLKDPNMYYNICLDEMNREANEKNSFDIVYAFVNQLENLVRSTKKRIRVICIGNTLQEASDILCAFNFLPETFGRFKIHKKRAILEYIEPSQRYLDRRKGTIADILSPDSSTFTNQTIVDRSRIYKGRLKTPLRIIKFGKEQSKWFTMWDSQVITQYNNENKPTIAMKPYINEKFIIEERDLVISMFDYQQFWYRDLITQRKFQKELELLKPRK